jgi:hypothetical protein
MKPVKINPLARRFLSWSGKRFYKSEAFSCARKLSEAQKVLICMPARMDRFTHAKESLPLFADIFKEKTIVVFIPFLKTDGYLSSPTGYEVIYPQKDDLKTFSIPVEKFIQRVTEFGFDISLDLDLDDGFLNRYLCLKCGIVVRFGPALKNSFPFYNIQLTVMGERSGSREVYEGMARVLKDLFAKSKDTTSNPI